MRKGETMTEQVFEIELLNPVQRPAPIPFEMAPRLSSLEGTTIVLLENTKTNSDKMLTYISEILQQEHRVRKTILHRKAHPSFSPTDDVLDDLASTADALVTGIGD
jgi:hypothetical protein